MGGATDVEVAQMCAREGRALVTLDLDFANPLRVPPESHAGIDVLRLHRGPSPVDLDAAIDTLTAALRLNRLIGELWAVEPRRIREHDRHQSGLD